MWNKIVSATESAILPSSAQAETATPTSAPVASAAPEATTAAAPAPVVDVEAVLAAMAQAKNGGGNWRESIVDLLKLLDMDSSLAARSTLANELDVHVGADGSAEENIALHKAVMVKMAENGGKVPDSLKH
jgi:hypothetical protein